MLHLKTFGGLSVDIDGTPGDRRGTADERRWLCWPSLPPPATGASAATNSSPPCGPKPTPSHGRGLLKQACYALRRDLHAPELFLGSIQLRLNPAVISSDVESFARAWEEHDPARAVAFYTAPFLDGFYLNGGGEFETVGGD